MKQKFLYTCALLALSLLSHAQDDVYPTKPYTGLEFITHGTVHVGNGQVLEDATIQIQNGKIVAVGKDLPVAADVKVYDARGKQVYPGLILAASDLGLKEISSGVRGSNDYREIGDYNPSVRSIVAYNTDSKIINTLKTNGIVLANVVPQGGIISGSSSVVQLDAWNWEDAAYKMDIGIHYNMPSFLTRRGRFQFFGGAADAGDPETRALEQIEETKNYFRQAKSYLAEAKHSETNLAFESLAGLFNKSKKLFVHADVVKQLLVAVDFVKEFGFDVVIVGGSDSWMIADQLKATHISVILGQMHNLPTMEDDDIDQPFKTPAMLQKAGVLFAINDDDGNSRYRNLPFNAGEASSYGLSKEEALSAITLNAAKILGIDSLTGSIEPGKDANIVISEGDILDMSTSIPTAVFIRGTSVNLENKQTELFERYKHKYDIK